MNVQSTGFEADHEMTAKLLHREIPIREVPIHYIPRSVSEGQKNKSDRWLDRSVDAAQIPLVELARRATSLPAKV